MSLYKSESIAHTVESAIESELVMERGWRVVNNGFLVVGNAGSQNSLRGIGKEPSTVPVEVKA